MATTTARSPGTILTPRVAVRSTLYSVLVALQAPTPARRLLQLAQELPLAPQRPRRLLLLPRVLLDAQHPGQLNSPVPGRLLVRHGQPIAIWRALVVAAPGLQTPHGETTRSAISLYARMVLRRLRQIQEAAPAAQTRCLKTGAPVLLAALVKPCSSHMVQWLPWLSLDYSPWAAS
jgi:hypothetical protein